MTRNCATSVLQMLDDEAKRKALWERLQFALDGEPDPWHEPGRARIDFRQFIPIHPVAPAIAAPATSIV